jgi:ribosomal protein S18 acetylase RimI-like enzyme
MAGRPIGRIQRAKLLERTERNLLAHFTYLHLNTPGMRVVEYGACVLSDSGVPTDSFNTVYVRGARTPLESEELRDALNHFRRSGLPFAAWVSPSASEGTTESLHRLGLHFAEEEPGLALDLEGWQPEGRDGPIQVHAVHDATAFADYARILTDSSDPPDENVGAFFGRSAHAALDPACPMVLLAGYCDGRAAATCEVLVAEGTAGIYNLATSPEHRRRGIGTAMLEAALAEAVSRGCDLACLQASPDGLPLYRRLGFEELCLFRVFQD